MNVPNTIERYAFTALLALTMPSLSARASTLDSAGIISSDDTSASVYVFEGVTVQDDLESASFDFETNQSPVTGQVTGQGSITLKDVVYTEKYLYTAGDFSGPMTFSAKPVKRGNIVTLSGAKVSAVGQRTGDVQIYDSGIWSSYPFTFSSKSSFSFSYLSVDASQQSPRLSGVIAAGRMSVTGSGYYDGKLVKKTVSIPYKSSAFSAAITSDNICHLDIDVSQLALTPKGSVTAYASRLLDLSDTVPNGYKATGSRNAKTGITKLTFTGAVAATRGTSATVNIDDDYTLKTGRGYSNSLKIYGYSLAF